MLANPYHRRRSRGSRGVSVRPRMPLACINCKERKLKCDDQVPSCANCQRFSLTCLIEDPVTRRRQARNYVETLEERVAFLENQLRNQSEDSGISVSPQTIHSTPARAKPAREEAPDNTSELSSRVGMLGLKVNGEEPHYLGSSSAFAFSRIVHSSLHLPSSRNHLETFGGSEQDASAHFSCPLPDDALAVRLGNAFFENIHPQYPFLHEPTFRQWEARLLMRPPDTAEAFMFDSVPLFFMNMVYAVGALLLPDVGPLPKQLYLAAQLHIDNVLSRDNIEAIQAILCCIMYSLRSSTGPSIWKLSGLALRQCIELGYHRSTRRFGSGGDSNQLEMRKRVFWCAHGIDCMTALTLGRPLGLSIHDVDAEFPMDIDDACITETDISNEPRSLPTDSPTTMSTALHVFRLRCLWARIHSSLYSDIATSRSDHPTYKDRVKELRGVLNNWIASIPPIPVRSGPALSIFATRDWYDLNYSETIILLYRGQLIRGRGIEDEVFLECARAAEHICHGYRRQYIGKPVNYTWGALHVLFSAGLTYLHCLWMSSVVRNAVWYDRMSRTLTDCIMVLVVMAERWKSAAPYRDTFETLSNRTAKMMVDSERVQWTLPTPSTPAAGASHEPGGMAQWVADISEVGMSEGIDSLLNGLLDDSVIQQPWPGL